MKSSVCFFFRLYLILPPQLLIDVWIILLVEILSEKSVNRGKQLSMLDSEFMFHVSIRIFFEF